MENSRILYCVSQQHSKPMLEYMALRGFFEFTKMSHLNNCHQIDKLQATFMPNSYVLRLWKCKASNFQMQSILQLKLMKEKPLTTNIVCRSTHIVLTNSNIIEFLFPLNTSWRDPLLLAWPQSLWMPWPCIEVSCLEMSCGRGLSHLGWMELMFYFIFQFSH